MYLKDFGFIDEGIASEELITNNNTMFKLTRTMAAFSRQVSISTGVILTGGSIADIFTITGGYIQIDGLVGFLTAACSANACTMALSFDPTTGAADIPIGTAVEMNAAAIGDMVSCEGDGTALVLEDQATNPCRMCVTPILGPPGGIDMDLQNSNLTTGTMDIILIWRALSPAAYVTVA